MMLKLSSAKDIFVININKNKHINLYNEIP